MINLIITDDHPIVRQGIRQILEGCIDINAIDEAENGEQLIRKIMKNEYDVVLLDISMPGRNGLEILKELKSIKPSIAVLILSVYPEEQYAIRAMKLGASGYLTKSSAPEELISAIQHVGSGRKYITLSLAETIANQIKSESEAPLHEALSERELEVMCQMAKGKSPKEIAEKLSISSKTLSTYRERILVKMMMSSTSEIIRYAIKNGLVD